MMILKSFIPDRSFIKRYIKIVAPIIVQQIFINSAIFVDNLMVGRLGKDPIIAIGAINAINFFFIIAMFATTHGSGIYVSQYNGKKDKENLKAAIAFKQQLLFLYSIITITLIWIFAPWAVRLYIEDIEANQNAINLAVAYYRIFSFSILFKAQNYGFSTTFQELGKPKLGMKASMASIVTNIVVNYILIFGAGPVPAMGLVGAAYGTVISKIASFSVWNFILDTSVVAKNIFTIIFYKSKNLYKKVLSKTIPLFWSEIFWVLTMMIKTRTFSTFSTDNFAAYSIQMNMETIVSVVWAAMWGATIYLVGKKLGSNNLEHAEERAHKIIGANLILGIIMSSVLLFLATPILSLYNISLEIKDLAWKLIIILALFYPLRMSCGSFFFVIRAGGQTNQSIKIDLISSWLVMVPILLIAKYYFALDIITVFVIVELTNIFKVLYGYYFFRKYHWLTSSVK